MIRWEKEELSFSHFDLVVFLNLPREHRSAEKYKEKIRLSFA